MAVTTFSAAVNAAVSFTKAFTLASVVWVWGASRAAASILARLATADVSRYDSWLTLAVTQLVCIGSLHTFSNSNVYYAAVTQRSAVEVVLTVIHALLSGARGLFP